MWVCVCVCFKALFLWEFVYLCAFDACVCGSALSLYGQMVAAMPSRTVALVFETNFKQQG